MIYTDTPSNLIFIIQSVGVISGSQLKRFFADLDDYRRLDYYLELLVRTKYLVYYKARDLYFSKDFVRLKDDRLAFNYALDITEQIVDDLISALWIVTSFPSREVKEILVLRYYPVQVLFITNDTTYEITVCKNKQDAATALKIRGKTTIQEAEDEVYHIALVNTEATGDSLKKFGFQCYAILDKEHRPLYYEWYDD